MSGSLRQSELFGGETWQTIYRAFTSINFNASDPPSINKALRTYLTTYFPEDFTDWQESSEFVALIDLLSWLAGTLAFRTDINARENFLDTAEARESILRLARFLSYKARRNQCARGLVKLVEISTDDDIIDSFGVNLNSTTVTWNDADNPDWFEQFGLVLNNAFIATNPFGVPLKIGTVSSTATQLYRLNNTVSSGVYPFNALVNGDSMHFELVNVDFDDGGGFSERAPDYDNAFHLVYLSDGNGNSSSRTGFFTMFKEGALTQQLFQLDVPVENRLIDIDASDINETDVWVQTLNDAGHVSINWTKVQAVVTDNVSFNAVPATVRNVFSVITRDNDTISLRFSDGRFGTVPIGTLRLFYRTSNGLSYFIRPQDMERVQTVIPYVNRNGATKSLFITFSLQETVSNSVPSETDEEVRRRAPQVYGTQNRMVSGEDYNVFPLQSNLASQIKAVNRVYAGHSRFIDLNDPTGTYQDTKVFSDDGILYSEARNAYDELSVSLNRTVDDMIDTIIQPALQREQTIAWLRRTMLASTAYPHTPTSPLYWYQSTLARFGNTGIVTSTSGDPSTGIIVGGTQDPSNVPFYVTDGAMLKFDTVNWIGVTSVSGAGNLVSLTGFGQIALTGNVPTGSSLLQALPSIRTTLTPAERAPLEERFRLQRPFSLWYDFIALRWTVVDLTATVVDAIRVMRVEYYATIWRFTTSGWRYVFESESDCRFYFDPTARSVESDTGLACRDTVRILRINPAPGSGDPLAADLDFVLQSQIFHDDGFPEPRSIEVAFADSNDDGFVDDPDAWDDILDDNAVTGLLFWKLYTETDNYEYYRPLRGVWVFANDTERLGFDEMSLPANLVAYCFDEDTFWQWTTLGGWTQAAADAYRWRVGRGANGLVRHIDGTTTDYTPSGLYYEWKHYAPTDHRIDPAQTNIIDIFVLDKNYDTQVRQWISTGTKGPAPTPPSELDLRLLFAGYEQFKMFSDQLVYRPVRFKYLFGQGAMDELRVKFKVVRLPNTAMSDGEIKSQIIRSINTYFGSGNWDFGETFYATELYAFLHTKLANVIGSVVIVPLSAGSKFGEQFEVRCLSDEIFISTAQVGDVDIILTNTNTQLRIS